MVQVELSFVNALRAMITVVATIWLCWIFMATLTQSALDARARSSVNVADPDGGCDSISTRFVREEMPPRANTVPILLDESASMATADVESNESRIFDPKVCAGFETQRLGKHPRKTTFQLTAFATGENQRATI